MFYLEARFDKRQSFYHKAFINEFNGGLRLYSYGLFVAFCDKDGNIKVLNDGNYDYLTQTTTRHIMEFIKQFSYETLQKYNHKSNKAFIKSLNTFNA